MDYIFRNKTVTKNIGKSVRTRLLNLAKEEKILFFVISPKKHTFERQKKKELPL